LILERVDLVVDPSLLVPQVLEAAFVISQRLCEAGDLAFGRLGQLFLEIVPRER
jgi:hypothetical protein